MDNYSDLVRLALLAITSPVALLIARFGYVGWRDGDRVRTWGAVAFLLLLGSAVLGVWDRRGESLSLPAVIYVLALSCSVMVLRTLYSIHPEWTRARLAAERADAQDVLAAHREEEDVLRANDRESQVGERADSRAMYDAGHLDESTATYDHRVEAREAQDENREHSHGLQDDERDAFRSNEDDRL